MDDAKDMVNSSAQRSEVKPEILLPRGDSLIISSSPHIHVANSVQKIMLKVMLALVPASAAGIFFFGWRGALVLALCVIFSVGAEMLWCRLAGKPVLGTVRDLSAALTGLLLGLNLPPTTPWWVCLIGAFLAIWLGKQIFGGLGHNPFNPAAVARVALLIALPAAMTLWMPARWMTPEKSGNYAEKFYSASDWQALQEKTVSWDEVTCATPLGLPDLPGDAPLSVTSPSSDDYWNYFIGNRSGCVGETSCLALLIGAALLLWWRLIKWQIPVAFLGTVVVFGGLTHWGAPETAPPVLFQLLTGGLMLGAWFMATDMVTSPVSKSGCVLFGIGCGLITCVIRLYGNYPEGISFSILLMNALVPLIDKLNRSYPFGYLKKKKEPAQ